MKIGEIWKLREHPNQYIWGLPSFVLIVGIINNYENLDVVYTECDKNYNPLDRELDILPSNEFYKYYKKIYNN